MSTLLVSLGVVGAAVVGVVLIALTDPDQPATNHPPSRRDGRHRRRMATLLPPPPSDAPRRESPVREDPVREPRSAVPERSRPAPGWLRLRSGVALVVLVTFVGLVLAALVGTTLALAARSLRHAVG